VRNATDLPILRKDFTISDYQIYEAAAAGANSILLIVSILSKRQLQEYVLLTRGLGMEPLVEIHSEWELENALYADAKIIGINNRNLETLKTDTTVAARVVPFFTADQIPVSASGVSGPADIQKGMDAGLFNFLVGESIVRADDTEKFIQDLISTGSNATKNTSHFPLVKVCGLTRPDEAVACAELGANAIGLIFYPKSPRSVTTAQATEICRALPGNIITTGVFVDASVEFIMEKVKTCGLKAVQLHGNETPKNGGRSEKPGNTGFQGAVCRKRAPH